MKLLRELTMVLHAGRLVATAQPVGRGRPLPQVLDGLCRLRGLPSSVRAAEGQRAVERAASRLRRFGLNDTCLIRSLALSALLSDRDGVQLHLGFRPTDSPGAILAGHAWVTLDGRPLPDDSATLVDGEPGEEVAVLIANRPGAARNHRERS